MTTISVSSKYQQELKTYCKYGLMLLGQLKTYVKCVYSLINQLICITNSECPILHQKTFRWDYNSRSTKFGASTGQILIKSRYANSNWFLLTVSVLVYTACQFVRQCMWKKTWRKDITLGPGRVSLSPPRPYPNSISGRCV